MHNVMLLKFVKVQRICNSFKLGHGVQSETMLQ